MAPPKITLTQRDLRSVERMAGCGLSLAEIASVLGISEDTLARRRAESDVVDQAVQRGRAMSASKVGNALYQKALRGDVPAIRWFEATRFGRSEKQVIESRDVTIEDLLRSCAEADAEEEAEAAGDVERVPSDVP